MSVTAEDLILAPRIRPGRWPARDWGAAGAARRLTRAYELAQEIPFDDDSRLVFFSDCHRGDNSRADEFARNEALFLQVLGFYNQAGFTYIEVGDGDELWQNRRFCSIRQAHGRVFDLLHQFHRQGRLHLITGNHDLGGDLRRPVVKDGIPTVESLILRHTRTQQRLFVVHGHQADFKSDRLGTLSRLAVRYLWRRARLWGLAQLAQWRDLDRDYATLERRLLAWAAARQQLLICGHTHHPRSAAYSAAPYFNTGSCLVPGVITGLELQGGELRLVRWTAGPDCSAGALRTLLAPPRLLRRFPGA